MKIVGLRTMVDRLGTCLTLGPLSIRTTRESNSANVQARHWKGYLVQPLQRLCRSWLGIDLIESSLADGTRSS